MKATVEIEKAALPVAVQSRARASCGRKGRLANHVGLQVWAVAPGLADILGAQGLFVPVPPVFAGCPAALATAPLLADCELAAAGH